MSEHRFRSGQPALQHSLYALARQTLLEARRTRLGWLLGAGVLAVLLAAEFGAALAVSESPAHRAAFAGAGLRAFGAILIVVFVSASMAREFNERAIDWVLAFAYPRPVYLGGRLLGYGAVAISVAVLLGGALLLVAAPLPVVYWTAAVGIEFVVLASVAVLCALTFTHVPTTVCAVLAFYVFARSVDTLLLIAHGPVVAARGLADAFLVALLDAVAMLVPHLGRFAGSDWLVYGGLVPADLAPLFVQGALFVALAGGAAAFDLYRRNF